MPFSPPPHPSGLPAYERVHVCGVDKTGKSSVAISCARLARATGSRATFHVIDTDRAWEWMLGPGDSNVHVMPAYEWESYLAAGKWLAGNVRPGDFVAVDLLSRAWDKVSDFYMERVLKEEPIDFSVRMAVEAERAKKPVQQYVIETQQIDYARCSKWYQAWLEPLAFRLPVHLFVMSEMKGLDKNERHEEVREMWDRVGMKPAGHWRTGHYVHETAFLQQAGAGDHRVTIKSRDYGGRRRAEVVGMPFRDFAVDVMMAKWGWVL